MIGHIPYHGTHDIFWMPRENKSYVLSDNNQSYLAGTCHVVVFGGPPRDEAICRPPPSRGGQQSANDWAVMLRRPAPSCQAVSFIVTLLSVDNQALIETPPVISSAGTLYFTPAHRQVGTAKFRVDMVDSGQVFEVGDKKLGESMGAPRFFTLQVLPINNAPSFVAHDVFCNQDTGMQKLIFASEVRAGGEHENYQRLTWRYEANKESLKMFSDGPFFEVTRMDGDLYGVVRFQTHDYVSGATNFKIELVDDGDLIPNRGDGRVSYHQNFTLTVRKVNQAPYFLFPETGMSVAGVLPSVIDAGTPTVYHKEEWAFNLTAGTPLEDLEQRVSFALHHVTAISSLWKGDGLITDLILWPNGTLVFTAVPGRSGRFDMHIKATDDGGTDYGGLDWAIVTVPLTIEPPVDELGNVVKSVPVLAGPHELNVPETKDQIRQVFPNYLKDIDLNVLAPEDRSNSFVFRFASSNAFLFLDGPDISFPDGTITFMLRPYSNGVAHLSLYLVPEGSNATYKPDATFPFDITVLPVNDRPSFSLLPAVGALQDSGPVAILGFAHHLFAGPPDESWQTIYYNTTFDTLAPNLFAAPPEIDMSGSLRFVSAPGQHGHALIRVVATDDGGIDFDGQSMSLVVESTLNVFPLPRVLDVVPAVLPATGGTNVTVMGLYFGSPYSRGYAEPQSGYGLLDVMIGGQRCGNVSVTSDTQVLCTVPAMVGTQSVEVVIREPGLVRSGRMGRTVNFNAVYFGGILQQHNSRGVVGTGPSSNASVPFIAWTPEGVVPSQPTEWKGVPISVDQLVVDNTVLSMLYFESLVFVGGNFKMAGVVKVNHIMEWNGGLVRALGKGVDGSVHSMIVYQNLLVVGGTFTKAYQYNGGSLRTGGLAGWRIKLDALDGQIAKWELVGAPLQGAVMASAVNGSRLFVGGRFNQFCSQRYNGVALYNGTSWEPLGQGVAGGNVLSMAVLGNTLYVGGEFSSAGGKPLSNVAAWNMVTSEWIFFGKVDGHVLSLLAWDGHILAGGTFTTAGGKLSFGVARYTPVDAAHELHGAEGDVSHAWSDGTRERIGVWNPVGRGVEGRVNRLVAAGGCLYAAGDLINVSEHNGTRPAITNLARYCPNGEEAELSALWEPAVLTNAGERQSLAPLYALASAIPPGRAHWNLRLPDYFWHCGKNATNATNATWFNSSIVMNATNANNGTCVRVEIPKSPLVFY